MLDNPYKQYKEQSIMTMTKGELLVRLYEECSRRLNQIGRASCRERV